MMQWGSTKLSPPTTFGTQKFCMDRTVEFQSFLEPQHQGVSNGEARNSDASSVARSGFNNEAARIGQEIHIAQLKLDELGKRMSI
jgi:hypothetical protein